MSDVEHEQETEAQEADPEAEEAEEAAEPATGPSEPEEDATDAEANRELGRALQNRRISQAKWIDRTLGDAALELLPCPMCFNGIQGYLHPGTQAEMTDEDRGNALAFLGAPVASELLPADGVVICDRCGGRGQLKYPGYVVHMQEQQCPKCAGNGYIPETQTNETRVGHVLESIAVAPPPSNGANACPICGSANMAGQPHWCVPAPVAA